jgi:hypothetical protein
MPFGEYESFEDCVSKNKDKSDPEAYCATIERKARGEAKVQTGNYNLAVFSEPFHITEDSHCCLKVDAVIAKEGIYDFPAGPNGENRRCLWSRDELKKASRTARAAKITILDHPPNKVVTAQEEIYGIVENAFYDRDRIRAKLNFDKEVCPPDFLEGIRAAAAKTGPPKDVSIGFYYVSDELPGTWHGQRYDLVMRNMVIDHVASGVWKGRCSWPDCGIGVSSVQMAAFLESRVQNKMEVKKQLSENQEKDEHGCLIGKEEWDGEKCVAKAGAQEENPDALKNVDAHGCYPDEEWSEEEQKCLKKHRGSEEVTGEDAPGEVGENTQPETAALIERSQHLLRLKVERDVERLKAERRHPA